MSFFPVITPDVAFASMNVQEEEHKPMPGLRRASDAISPTMTSPKPNGRPLQFQMCKSARLSSSAADVLDRPVAGPSNISRVSSAASFRSHELERAAAEMSGYVSPADRYKTHYATSPLAPRQAIRSPSQTPPMNSPDLSRFQRAGSFRRTSLTNDSSDYYDFLRRWQVEASPIMPATPRSVKNRRRLSEQSFASGHSLSSSFSQATNFGTLIGSYEESLLSGRMSTMPSKPFMFDAELGVLGLGKCRADLRCPPHVSLKFPAHFYDLEGAALEKEGKVSPSSPYVGTINLESYYIDRILADDGLPYDTLKPTFPGYRVPPKGQVQLIIKNPNLTAVKVFLVPYDVSDMKAGQKTFVRQKSYFTTPATPKTSPRPASSSSRDVPLDPNGDNERSPSAGRPSAHRTPSQPRDALRYAVHLQFCAIPAAKSRQTSRRERHAGFDPFDRLRGEGRQQEQGTESTAAPRVYLHKNIRVVFSARFPDKKEKCTVTTDTPRMSEAKGGGNLYSTYPGPSEEWTEARRLAKQRDVERRALARRDHLAPSDGVFGFHEVGNSDPNGERLDAQERAGNGGEMGRHTRHTSRNGEEDESLDSPLRADYGATSEALDIPSGNARAWEAQHPLSTWRERPAAVQTMEIQQPFPLPADGERAPYAGASLPAVDAAYRTSMLTAPSRQRASTLHLNIDAPRADAITSPAGLRTPPVEPTYNERALLEQFHSSLGLRSQQHTPTFGANPSSMNTSANRPASPSYMRPRPMSPPGALPSGALRNGLQQTYSPAITTAMTLAMTRTSSNGSLAGATSPPAVMGATAHARLSSGSSGRVTPQPLQAPANAAPRPSFTRRMSSTSSSS